MPSFVSGHIAEGLLREREVFNSVPSPSKVSQWNGGHNDMLFSSPDWCCVSAAV
jgi:hypothetical protein